MPRRNESFVDFAMMKKIKKAESAGVIHPNAPLDSEYEEHHLSKLERMLRALDEVEDYVSIYTLVKYHRETFIRILEYMNKEGETNERNA